MGQHAITRHFYDGQHEDMLNWRGFGGEHLQRPLDDPSFATRVWPTSHTVAKT